MNEIRPEQGGAFAIEVERSTVTISLTDSYAYEAWAKAHNRALRRLTEAHNRDMEAARARIAVLEKDKCSGPDCGKPSQIEADPAS